MLFYRGAACHRLRQRSLRSTLQRARWCSSLLSRPALSLETLIAAWAASALWLCRRTEMSPALLVRCTLSLKVVLVWWNGTYTTTTFMSAFTGISMNCVSDGINTWVAGSGAAASTALYHVAMNGVATSIATRSEMSDANPRNIMAFNGSLWVWPYSKSPVQIMGADMISYPTPANIPAVIRNSTIGAGDTSFTYNSSRNIAVLHTGVYGSCHVIVSDSNRSVWVSNRSTFAVSTVTYGPYWGCENVAGGQLSNGAYSFLIGSFQVVSRVRLPGLTSSLILTLPSGGISGLTNAPFLCPAGYYCDMYNYSTPQPIICPTGTFCPAASGAPTACVAGTQNSFPGMTSLASCNYCPVGTYSTTGASECVSCPSNTTTVAVGSPSSAACAVCAAGFFGAAPTCTLCPRGHYCPANTTSWARLNCGRGNYCPLGSAAPLPCPILIPPNGGWGAQQVQGPAFMVETAACLAQCFFDPSSTGLTSSC